MDILFLDDASIRIDFKKEDVLVVVNGDIDIGTVDLILGFELKVEEVEKSAVKIVTSFNSGKDWYTWRDKKWQKVSLSKSKVSQEGMSIKGLEGVRIDDWEYIREDSETIRFAYFIPVNKDEEASSIKELFGTFHMLGRWRASVHGKDYDYEYTSNSRLQVYLYSSGA